MHEIKVSGKKIGDNHPCFIIAEAGVNHNGKLDLAKQLVDQAVKADVDAIKFQTYKSEEVVIKKSENAKYAQKNIGNKISQLDLLKSFELSYEDFREIRNYCDDKKILFLSTPHSYDAIDFLDDLVPAFKFGSGDLTNLPALIHAGKKGKPMIIGTGMAIMSEVKQAIDAIKKNGNNSIIALHCTTNYPCPFDEVNLNALISMKEELDCLIGFSDHTLGITVPIMAVTLGACVIEKHFTIDRTLPGPDHKASLEPFELENMVKQVRKAEIALGSCKKEPTLSEKDIMPLVRKSIVASKDMKKNEKVNFDSISIKRPGHGLSPKYIDDIIGKKLKRNINKNEFIRLQDLE